MKKEFSLLDIFFIGIISAILRRIIFIPVNELGNPFAEFIQSNIGDVISYLVLIAIISAIYYLIKNFRRKT